jgi:hypothetical protein
MDSSLHSIWAKLILAPALTIIQWMRTLRESEDTNWKVQDLIQWRKQVEDSNNEDV